jgi:hypothetical protein
MRDRVMSGLPELSRFNSACRAVSPAFKWSKATRDLAQIASRLAGAAKMSHRALIISPQVKNRDFIDHCGRSILYGSYGGRIDTMFIETILFITVVVMAGAAIVKAYERRQDVLYGPYMKRVD